MNAVSFTSINILKNRLDNFVHAQNVYFNWKADLTGTGDQSKIIVIQTLIICNLVVKLCCGYRGLVCVCNLVELIYFYFI